MSTIPFWGVHGRLCAVRTRILRMVDSGQFKFNWLPCMVLYWRFYRQTLYALSVCVRARINGIIVIFWFNASRRKSHEFRIKKDFKNYGSTEATLHESKSIGKSVPINIHRVLMFLFSNYIQISPEYHNSDQLSVIIRTKQCIKCRRTGTNNANRRTGEQDTLIDARI